MTTPTVPNFTAAPESRAMFEVNFDGPMVITSALKEESRFAVVAATVDVMVFAGQRIDFGVRFHGRFIEAGGKLSTNFRADIIATPAAEKLILQSTAVQDRLAELGMVRFG